MSAAKTKRKEKSKSAVRAVTESDKAATKKRVVAKARPKSAPVKRKSAATKSSKRVRQKSKAAKPDATAFGASENPASSALSGFAGQLVNWADKLSGVAAPFANMALTLAKTQFNDPPKKAAIKAAGSLLRQAREAMGMTAKEVGKAIDMKDSALLEQAETGKVALPFEMVLRLASVLGRHDPVSFALNLTRSYNPELWQAMEALGVGKLAVQAGRERELANIYRRRDMARRLNDKEFAALLALVGAAFDMGLEFRNQS